MKKLILIQNYKIVNKDNGFIINGDATWDDGSKSSYSNGILYVRTYSSVALKEHVFGYCKKCLY